MMKNVSLKPIYGVAAMLSLLLSVWLAYQNAVINPDGLCYLRSAANFAIADWNNAVTVCGQTRLPLYPFLISVVSVLTPLSALHAAFFLNAVFSIISVLCFIRITEALGGNKRVLLFAALSILLAYDFNVLRADILRDHGFWAFYLLSILLLLKYMQVRTWAYAWCWSVSLLIASMFRIEAVYFLLGLPFVVILFSGVAARGKTFLQLYSLSLLGLGCLGVACALGLVQWDMPFLREHDVYFQLLHGGNLLLTSFHDASLALKTHVLSHLATEDSNILLVLFLAVWYLNCVVTSLTFFVSGLICYAWKKHVLVLVPEKRAVLLAYLSLNVLVTLAFLVENLFISKRYLLALSLTLLLWVPFVLNYLYEKCSAKWFYILLTLFMLNAVGGIYSFGVSKNYIRLGGNWLATLPSDAKIYSNDEMILFYSQHFAADLIAKGQSYQNLNTITAGKWRQFDYVALRNNMSEAAKNAAVIRELHAPMVKRYVNARGDEVLIYQVSQKKGSQL